MLVFLLSYRITIITKQVNHMRPAEIVRWTVGGSNKCTRGCGFCDSGAGPAGCHISTSQVRSFSLGLLRCRNEGLIEIGDDIIFTGGGECLENEDLPELARIATTVSRSIAMITSGASNRREERRLVAFAEASQFSNISLSFDPESPESYERIERSLRLKLSPQIGVRMKFWPDWNRGQMKEALAMLAMVFRKAGCSVYGSLVHVPVQPLILTLSHQTSMQVRSVFGSIIYTDLDPVEPNGKARKRLADRMFTVRKGMLCEEMGGGIASIHCQATDSLSHCCEANRATSIPMSYDGIHELLATRAAVRYRLLSNIYRAAGNPVYDLCDLCELR